MMSQTLAGLLEEADKKGVTLSLDGGRVLYSPRPNLDAVPHLKARLADRLDEVREWLRGSGATTGTSEPRAATVPASGRTGQNPGRGGSTASRVAPEPQCAVPPASRTRGNVERAESRLAEGKAVQIESSLVGRFWYATNPNTIRRFRTRGEHIYGPDEIALLEDSRSDPRQVPRVKQMFEGTVVPAPDAETPAIASPAEGSQACSPPRDADIWTEDQFEILNWFEDVGIHQIPAEPFRLAPHHVVTAPDLWRQSLLNDIARGPRGPRCQYGALFKDIELLKGFINGREQK